MLNWVAYLIQFPIIYWSETSRRGWLQNMISFCCRYNYYGLLMQIISSQQIVEQLPTLITWQEVNNNKTYIEITGPLIKSYS